MCGFVGLIRKAGGLVFGSEAVLRSVRNGRASLVLVSQDSGEATARRFCGECERHQVPMVRVGKRSDFGRVAGRSAVSVVAVTNRSLANALLVKFETDELKVLGNRNGDRQGGS